MRKCKTCKKQLRKNERNYCTTCSEFHKHHYSQDKRKIIQKEYERLGK